MTSPRIRRGSRGGQPPKKDVFPDFLSFGRGIAGIERQGIGASQKLPASGLQPQFMPQKPLLDAILYRPNSDERLVHVFDPLYLDPELLNPACLKRVRMELRRLFQLRRKRKGKEGKDASLFTQAEEILDQDDAFDQEVSAQLAALMRA